MNSLKYQFKNAFKQSDNALMQLIIINIAIFVILGVLLVFSTLFGFEGVFEAIYRQFTIPPRVGDFIMRPWTIITYAFTHSLSGLFHILFNMLILYWFGKLVQEYLGSDKVLSLYVLGALAGGIAYLLAYNLVPYYAAGLNFPGMVGASAAVYAVSVAAATLMPNYTFHLIFLGPVKIKYIVLVYIFISFLGSVGGNAGGNIAHLGGALMGFVFIKQLQQGRDFGKPVVAIIEFFKGLFSPRPKIKVSYTNPKAKYKKATERPKSDPRPVSEQEEIDLILDKISASGYESLTKDEKQKLFNASRK